MNRNFKLSVFIFIFFLSLLLPRLNAEEELPLISMDLQDANLKDVLKIFSIQSGLNFIASEAVQDRKITLYLDKVSIKDAMDKLSKANNLSYELDKEANIFIVKDWGKPQIETITKVFYLKYATVSSSSLREEMQSKLSSQGATAGQTAGAGQGAATGGSGKWQAEQDVGITKAIKKVLTEYGSVIEDYRTNSLIVTDIPSRMPIITQTIAALDVPVPQVMLEVEMLDVSKNTVDKIGIKFGQTPLTLVLTGAKRGILWPFRDTSRPMASESKMTPGSIDFSTATYTVLLEFLRTQTDTKYLARPRILTLNNETAEIKITAQETVGRQTTTTAAEGQSSQTTGVAERMETGVTLRVTPQINVDSGEVTMFIMPTVKDTSTSTFAVSDGSSTFFKDPEERSTRTTVRVKDGETVIIGGLIRNEFSETITKLPLLGDIPLIGRLFRHRNKEKGKERELLVFITPHIIRDTNIELVQKQKMVDTPLREQNTVSVGERIAVINSSLNTFEKKR